MSLPFLQEASTRVQFASLSLCQASLSICDAVFFDLQLSLAQSLLPRLCSLSSSESSELSKEVEADEEVEVEAEAPGASAAVAVEGAMVESLTENAVSLSEKLPRLSETDLVGLLKVLKVPMDFLLPSVLLCWLTFTAGSCHVE